MANPWDIVMPPQGQGMLMASVDPNMQQEQQQGFAPPQAEMLPEVPPRQPTSPAPQHFTTSYQQQFDDAFRQNMDRRGTGNDDLRTKLNAALAQDTSGLQGMDLSALYSYADSLMGTRTAGNYKAPTIKQDKKAEADKLQKAISDGENMMADDQLGYLKLKLQEELYKKQSEKEDHKTNRAQTTLANGMRSQWLNNPTTKDSQNIATAYEKIRSSAASANAAGDMSLVFSYMKILDPSSTVREGEYANAKNATGWSEQMRNHYNRAKDGTLLSAEQRAQFVKEAEGLFRSQMQQQERFNTGMIDIAARSGINPDDVVLPSLFKVKPSEGKSQGRQASLSAEDQQAREWLKANPTHPSAGAIKQKLGVK